MPFVTAKGGLRVGKHFAGKERACMVVVDDRGNMAGRRSYIGLLPNHRIPRNLFIFRW